MQYDFIKLHLPKRLITTRKNICVDLVLKDVNTICISSSVKHPQIYILEIVEKFVRFSQELFPICIHTQLTHNW